MRTTQPALFGALAERPAPRREALRAITVKPARAPSASRSRCSVCHRPLSDPGSVALGMGSTCAEKHHMETIKKMNGDLFDMRPPQFRATYSYTIEDGVVAIVDQDQGRSVTNDIDNVIADLVKAGVDVDSMRIMYRDTMGHWDGILTRNGEFEDFLPLRKADKGDARRLLLEKVSQDSSSTLSF